MQTITLQDGLEFFDEDNNKVIFNHYSFCEWLKWIMVKYASKTYQEADKLVRESYFNITPHSYDDVFYITHELDYHWAMLLVYGEMYWLRGIPSDYNGFFEEYTAWEKEIKEKYNLKDSYHYFDIEEEEI